MFCIACGTRLPDDAAYCSACGRAVHHPEGEQTPAAAAAPEEASPPESRASTAAPNMAGTARSWSEAGGIPYLWNGRWWSRGPSGEVVVWDASHDNWDLALSTQTPFFMKRPRFTSLKTPAIWTCIVLGFFALFSLLAVVADLQQAYVANRLDGGRAVTQDELDDARSLFEGMKGLQLWGLIIATPLFLWWMQRGVSNLTALGSLGQEHTRGWAIGWWFIPAANMVQPLRVLLEVWRGSSARSTLEPDDAWRSRPNDAVTVVWWVLCVIGFFSWWIVGATVTDLETADPDRFAWAVAAVCVDAALILLAGLAMAVVVRLTRRQENANEQFDVPSGSVAGPAAAAAQPSW